MPAITKEYLDSLPDETIFMIRDYIWDRFGNRPVLEIASLDRQVEADPEPKLACDSKRCPHCGGEDVVKNGCAGKMQRFLCKRCRKTFTATSGTVMASSKIPPVKILEMIECEIEGLSVKETSYRTKLSETTCFNFRQRLYSMASAKMEEVQLQGQIQVDSTYAKINLSGTRPENMPRLSKKRGKKYKVVGEFNELRGVSHHKICIATAIDENDNILYRVAGLGRESAKKYEQYGDHFNEGKKVIADDDKGIARFAKDHDMELDVIPSGCHTTPNGNSLGDINQIHQTLKDLSRQKHGLSTRHLPGYLNWIAYTKKLKYTVEREQIAETIYRDLHETEAKFIRDDISTSEQPISLYEAYSEYHYGIFSTNNA